MKEKISIFLSEAIPILIIAFIFATLFALLPTSIQKEFLQTSLTLIKTIGSTTNVLIEIFNIP